LTLGGAYARVLEEWTYNLGPSKFLLFIRLENGRIVRKERGDYGY